MTNSCDWLGTPVSNAKEQDKYFSSQKADQPYPNIKMNEIAM